jgi:hypothetical protein
MTMTFEGGIWLINLAYKYLAYKYLAYKYLIWLINIWLINIWLINIWLINIWLINILFGLYISTLAYKFPLGLIDITRTGRLAIDH